MLVTDCICCVDGSVISIHCSLLILCTYLLCLWMWDLACHKPLLKTLCENAYEIPAISNTLIFQYNINLQYQWFKGGHRFANVWEFFLKPVEFCKHTWTYMYTIVQLVLIRLAARLNVSVRCVVWYYTLEHCVQL